MRRSAVIKSVAFDRVADERYTNLTVRLRDLLMVRSDDGETLSDVHLTSAIWERSPSELVWCRLDRRGQLLQLLSFCQTG
jgi:hypothetical protein